MMDQLPEAGFPSGPRYDGFLVTQELHDLIMARGPCRRVGEPALIQLGSQRRAVEKALQEGRPVEPKAFASMLGLAPITYAKRLAFIAEYVAAKAGMQAERCVQLLTRALEDCRPAGEGYTIIDYEVAVRVHGRSFTVNHAAGNGHTGTPDACREFELAQEAMAKRTAFGWITSVGPGFQITAPSRTICRMLNLGYEDLNGSFLLGDPLVSKFQAMLENFGEWALLIGMLTHSTLNAERSGGGYLSAQAEVERFFGWLKSYVTTDYKSVAEQVERAPDELVDGDSSRNDLRQCLAAALDDAEWPPFNNNRHNTFRMHIKSHPLLSGGIARFAKTSRPIYSGRQVLGYEVTWDAENADRVANELMRAVLTELGLVTDATDTASTP
jgi:hypothetical protein